MKKYLVYIFGLIAILLLVYSYTGLENEAREPVVFIPDRPAPKPAVFPKWKDSMTQTAQVKIPFVGKDFVGFKEALAFNESGGRYDVVNSLGFMGKYQFGAGTLRQLRINRKDFLRNPRLQEEAFRRYVLHNRKYLEKEIQRFSGKYIRGVKITESGILAAAHLAGAGAVKRFLNSHGRESASDAFGTRIEDYLRRFADYDLSSLSRESHETAQ